jgi:hypothetical protein
MAIRRERIVSMHNYDHASMCRFPDAESEGYKSISSILEDWIDERNDGQL